MTTRYDRSSDCDAIVIGSGPYGLATAAHLKAQQIATHVFGRPMSFWRQNMPKGMRLRSPWGATTISDAEGALSLDAFVADQQIPPEEPLPLETFVDYGTWFQRRAVPDLDERVVDRIETAGAGFRAIMADGEAVHGRRVIIATGLAHQEFRPAAFANVPRALASHACEHDNLDVYRGKHVAVVGRGQSACESPCFSRRRARTLKSSAADRSIGSAPKRTARRCASGWRGAFPNWRQRLPASGRFR